MAELMKIAEGSFINQLRGSCLIRARFGWGEEKACCSLHGDWPLEVQASQWQRARLRTQSPRLNPVNSPACGAANFWPESALHFSHHSSGTQEYACTAHHWRSILCLSLPRFTRQ